MVKTLTMIEDYKDYDPIPERVFRGLQSIEPDVTVTVSLAVKLQLEHLAETLHERIEDPRVCGQLMRDIKHIASALHDDGAAARITEEVEALLKAINAAG